MNDVEILFDELLFGSGKIFGIILIFGLVFVIAYKIKYSGIVFFPILYYLSNEYYTNIEASDDFFICWILTLIAMIFVIFYTINQVKNRDND